MNHYVERLYQGNSKYWKIVTRVIFRPLLIASIAITSVTGLVAVGWQLDTTGLLQLWQESSQTTVLSMKHRARPADIEKIFHLNALSFQLLMFCLIWLWFAWGAATELFKSSTKESHPNSRDVK